MKIGKVVGNVVATRKDERLRGLKLLLVQTYKIDKKSGESATLKETSDYVVAIDTVEAGAGEIVLLVSGSSARQTDKTNGKPVDAAVIGILEEVKFLDGDRIMLTDLY